jgi:hypothetical protein
MHAHEARRRQVRLLLAQDVHGHPVRDADAAVLDAAVRIAQEAAHRTHVGLHGDVHERLDPVAVGHLDVVVEEDQHVAGGGRGAAVDQAREVEVDVGPHHPVARALEQRARPRLRGAVVHQHHLERAPARLRHPLEEPRDQLGLVAGRDDDGDPRTARPPLARPERARQPWNRLE